MLRIGEVNFIYASTNYLHTLTEAMLRRGLEPKRAFPTLRTLFIAAEGYPIEWAQRIEELWGTRLQEGYGSTQCAGFGASTCADGVLSAAGGRGLMHMFEWETLFEVLDPVYADAGQVRRDRRTRRHQSFDRRLAGDPLPHR